MDPILGGALVSAGANLVGGLFGKSSSEKAQAQNIASQKEFAQHGIRWKVADAEAAGVHPLYALGAQTHSFQPIGINGNDVGAGIAGAGQEIGRAIQAKATSGERLTAFQAQSQGLTLQRMQLENQILASDLARKTQAGAPPPLNGNSPGQVISGQGNAVAAKSFDPVTGLRGAISDVPLERTASAPGRPYQEPGAINEAGFTRTPTGYAPVMSNDAKQRLEEDFFGTLGWQMRNRVLPAFASGHGPSDGPYPAPRDMRWLYNPVKMEYVLIPRSMSAAAYFSGRYIN